MNKVVFPSIRFLEKGQFVVRCRARCEGKRGVPASERILYGNSKGVTDMQTTIDGRRRERDNKGPLRSSVSVRGQSGREEAMGLPPVVPARFHCDGVVITEHRPGGIYGGPSEDQNKRGGEKKRAVPDLRWTKEWDLLLSCPCRTRTSSWMKGREECIQPSQKVSVMDDSSGSL